MIPRGISPVLVAFFLVSGALQAANYAPASVDPPAPEREFRGVWIATVHNIDWPSREGLPAETQREELIAILEKAVELNLNAIVLQIRSECDAFYPSSIEPWSPWLTGTMGKSPGYDPLQFALEECHKRGLELHAWFNPFRAVNSEHGRICDQHVTRTHKDKIRYYGKKVWLEPTDEFARELCLDVVRDVLTRYEVDAIHIDDYFYPYPIKNRSGKWQQFNDAASWKKYQDAGGEGTRDDWRRQSINRFVLEMHREIKKVRPTCKFGVSPFGIWRPGYPEQVKISLDAYSTLYADAREWWRRGWLDYLAPQLYWSTEHEQYGFPGLYDWWRDENLQKRHLWPGIATYRIKSKIEPKRTASDSLKQVQIARDHCNIPQGPGHIHYSVKSIMENRANVADVLKNNAYKNFALIPESPWLSKGKMPKVDLRVAGVTDVSVILQWEAEASKAGKVRWWLLQAFEDGAWKKPQLLTPGNTNFAYQGFPEKVAITPVGVAGELGKTAGVKRVEAESEEAKPIE